MWAREAIKSLQCRKLDWLSEIQVSVSYGDQQILASTQSPIALSFYMFNRLFCLAKKVTILNNAKAEIFRDNNMWVNIITTDDLAPGIAKWVKWNRFTHADTTQIRLWGYSYTHWKQSKAKQNKTHKTLLVTKTELQWRHNERDGVSNQRRLECLLKRLFRCRSRKTSKLSVTGLCGGMHRWPVDSPPKGPVMQKKFPFDDVIMGIFPKKSVNTMAS